MNDREANLERHEHPKDFELFISITRHGPKAGLQSEDLSATGKQDVADYFLEAYKNVSIDNKNRKQVVSSRIKRVIQTAQTAEHSLQSYNEAKPIEIELDERISEQGIDALVRALPEERRNYWFQYWYQSELMPTAVSNFTDWILEKIEAAKNQGGTIEIDAYSHGPLMAAFLLKLEDNLGVQITGQDKNDPSRFGSDKLFGTGGEFDILSNFNIQMDSKNPEFIRIIFHGRSTDVPIRALKEMI